MNQSKILPQVTKPEAEDIINEVDRLSYTGQAPPLASEEIESLLKENNIARICTMVTSEFQHGDRRGIPLGQLRNYFDSLADVEAITARMFSDGGMKRISREFHQLVEATSFSANIWYLIA